MDALTSTILSEMINDKEDIDLNDTDDVEEESKLPRNLTATANIPSLPNSSSLPDMENLNDPVNTKVKQRTKKQSSMMSFYVAPKKAEEVDKLEGVGEGREYAQSYKRGKYE